MRTTHCCNWQLDQIFDVMRWEVRTLTHSMRRVACLLAAPAAHSAAPSRAQVDLGLRFRHAAYLEVQPPLPARQSVHTARMLVHPSCMKAPLYARACRMAA
jgi:hypothetical protein